MIVPFNPSLLVCLCSRDYCVRAYLLTSSLPPPFSLLLRQVQFRRHVLRRARCISPLSPLEYLRDGTAAHAIFLTFPLIVSLRCQRPFSFFLSVFLFFFLFSGPRSHPPRPLLTTSYNVTTRTVDGFQWVQLDSITLETSVGALVLSADMRYEIYKLLLPFEFR